MPRSAATRSAGRMFQRVRFAPEPPVRVAGPRRPVPPVVRWWAGRFGKGIVAALARPASRWGGGRRQAGRPRAHPLAPAPGRASGGAFFSGLTGAIRKPPVCRACGPLRPRCAREMPARRTAGDGARRAPSRGRRSAPVRCSTAGREAPRQKRKPSPWLRPATPWRSPLYTRRTYAGGTRRRALAGTSSRRRNANGVPSGRLRGRDHP